MHKVALFSLVWAKQWGCEDECRWGWVEMGRKGVWDGDLPIIPSKRHNTPLKQARTAFIHTLFH
jgi:hypothetical protein